MSLGETSSLLAYHIHVSKTPLTKFILLCFIFHWQSLRFIKGFLWSLMVIFYCVYVCLCLCLPLSMCVCVHRHPMYRSWELVASSIILHFIFWVNTCCWAKSSVLAFTRSIENDRNPPVSTPKVRARITNFPFSMYSGIQDSCLYRLRHIHSPSMVIFSFPSIRLLASWFLFSHHIILGMKYHYTEILRRYWLIN